MIAHEWGLAGMEALRDTVSVYVIVDVLSFSTAVDVATARGAHIYPFPLSDYAAAETEAQRRGIALAMPRSARGGQFSLSPRSLESLPADFKLMLPSPNGSRLSLAGGRATVIAGCLRNARAVARLALERADGDSIGVISAGECWPDGSLRPAIEDLLGAGAIIHHLGQTCTPEADLAAKTYQHSREMLRDLICRSQSGKELSDRGFSDDVEMALMENISVATPVLTDGAYRAFAAT